MRKLSDTVAHLAAIRAAMPASPVVPERDRLREVEAFGSDPGNLRGLVHVPRRLADRPALVVVLHGCTQTAAGYDAGSGWSAMADEHGFILLFPEQRRANNPNLCFNWFSPEDIRRDGGEALSIRQMVEAVVRDHGVDPARVFVTGLSAGGAMAAVMLATYPEVFAGGAVIAGLPYGSASGVSDALARMRGPGGASADELGGVVRRASAHRGQWPTLSIWHGTGDTTVSPANAEALLGQWRSLHGAQEAPSEVETVAGHPRRVWRDADGREVIEAYSIAGMGHGTPLDTTGDDGCGAVGPYMLQANISSTRRIAAFWGLTGGRRAAPRSSTQVQAAPPALQTASPARRPAEVATKPDTLAGGVRTIIDDALRAAGLMR